MMLCSFFWIFDAPKKQNAKKVGGARSEWVGGGESTQAREEEGPKNLFSSFLPWPVRRAISKDECGIKRKTRSRESLWSLSTVYGSSCTTKDYDTLWYVYDYCTEKSERAQP